ncbi:MAG TPA: DNA cytosine methyltransferase, partial [Dehalococcoidia bacterium]|nr:DNA cytosine methyltransferase [Dehalococcoidia bacterium]
VGPVDLVVGGTPCTGFSIAGLRKGLDDDRSNLALQFCRIIDQLRPTWFLWENVAHALRINEGRDFGTILGAVEQCGYGWAYRVLDAQYLRVAQRRRRVFVVGHLGDWRRAAAVLFEPESLRRHPPPRREAGQAAARPVASCARGGSRYRNAADQADNLIARPLLGKSNSSHDDSKETYVAMTLNAKGGAGRSDGESETFVTHTLRADGFDASEDGTGRGTPLVTAFSGMAQGGRGWAPQSCPTSEDLALTLDATRAQAVAFAIRTAQTGANGIGVAEDVSHTLDTAVQAVAIAENQRAEVREMDVVSSLNCSGGKPGTGYPAVMAFTVDNKMHGWESAIHGSVQTRSTDTMHQLYGVRQGTAVRRLMPVECEALQGLPRNHTAITYRGKAAADGNRYRSIGNAMAVPVIKWILERLERV